MENRKVIIVGAGIGGLASGFWLKQRGYEVEIIEASDRPGGRMASLERNGDKVDVGMQFYHSDYRLAFQLMDAVGLADDKRKIKGKLEFSLKDGSTFLWDHNSPYIKLLGLRGNLKLYWFVLRYLLLGRRFPMYRIAEDIPEYDNREVLDLFSSPSDKPLRDYLVTPVSFGENMGLPEWMSLYHFLHQFRLTTFTGFVGLARGVSSLPEELAKLLSVEYEAPARRLVVEKDRVVGVQMEKDGSIRRAGHVIVAVEPSAAARLMPDELAEQRQFFESIVYSPMPMPVFFLDKPLRQDVWCYFSDPTVKQDFMMAIDEHAKVPDMSPSGKAVVTAWSGHPMTLDLIDLPDDELISRAQKDVESMLPGFSQHIGEATVFRHQYGVTRYPPGSYRRVIDFRKKAEDLQGVSFVSSLFGGTMMEGALINAAEAVSRVCGWGGTK
jgi:protoporphyrinogen oxidase